MGTAKVEVADRDGAFVIKLCGDVRLNYCTVLDDFFERMFGSRDFKSVLIDMRDTENADSTTLGLLAKLAIRAKQDFNFIPVILSTNPSVSRVLQSMSFDKVFHICDEPLGSEQDLEELPLCQCSEDSAKKKVLEAHRCLMGLSKKNQVEFRELVSNLEQH